MSYIDGSVAAVETARELAFIDHAKGVDAERGGGASDDAERLDGPGHRSAAGPAASTSKGE
ncbi:hypothetical protein [Sorangium sp. So ce1099]|uniref:hypothetical protein n=1 Tax=Sorangium sp. So ce1099 TaxID=3133331 RepID=UPI003F63562C